MSIEQYKVILDAPAKNPALGFTQYAHAFKGIIEHSEPRFAIGIFGGWGSGKTTLMDAIEGSLDKNLIIPVQFSAWRYEKEPHLIIPLLDAVREAIADFADKEPNGQGTARRTAATIGKVAKALVAGLTISAGVPGAMTVSLKANEALAEADKLDHESLEARVPRSFYYASFRALNDAFAEFARTYPGRRIVVFVDDLDRCLPEGALQVLESMKLFFDIRGFVFIVGLDRTIVEALIEAKYRSPAPAAPVVNLVDRETTTPVATQSAPSNYQVQGADYTKKIFQVPFTLAPVAVGQLGEFLSSLYNEAGLFPEQRSELENVVRPHLDYVVSGEGVNPREIKRYINAYTVAIKVKPWLDKNIVLALQTISFRTTDWRRVREGLYAYREAFTAALRRRLVNNEQNALEDLDPLLSAIPRQFLDYAAPSGPGHNLVAFEGSLDEYIYSGEATHSTVDPKALDVIPRMNKVRRSIETIDLTDQAAIAVIVDQIQDVMEQFYGRGSNLETTGASSSRERMVQDLRTLMNNLRKPILSPQATEEEIRTWREDQELIARQIQEDILSLFQYASLSA